MSGCGVDCVAGVEFAEPLAAVLGAVGADGFSLGPQPINVANEKSKLTHSVHLQFNVRNFLLIKFFIRTCFRFHSKMRISPLGAELAHDRSRNRCCQKTRRTN
jgi:hypothetical protein